MSTITNNFAELAKINVNQFTEKKNGLTYLSWAWAVDQLLRRDPLATWTYAEPVKWGDTVMVFCTVTAFGKQMTAQLPVMDHRNKAIANPDAFAVNNAMQRCLAKAIALHGLGLYIYNGEDLPPDDGNAASGATQRQEPAKSPVTPVSGAITDKTRNALINFMEDAKTAPRVEAAMKAYKVKSIDAFTEDQGQKIIAKLAAEIVSA